MGDQGGDGVKAQSDAREGEVMETPNLDRVLFMAEADRASAWPVLTSDRRRLVSKGQMELAELKSAIAGLRAENARLQEKYVRCVGCGGRDPLVEDSYCLRCVQEGDRDTAATAEGEVA